jgi:hypothetical protein
MMFSKKGQSALEYLMTYGWALVVIVIVIAALVFLVGGTPASAAKTCSGEDTYFGYSLQLLSGTDYNIELLNKTGTNISAPNYEVTLSSGTAKTDWSEAAVWRTGAKQVFSFESVAPDESNEVTVTVTHNTAVGPITEIKTCRVS